MPREYDVTALKPFDYQGREIVAGESFRAGLIDVLKLAHQRRIRLNTPITKPILKKKRGGRPRKSETVCNSSA